MDKIQILTYMVGTVTAVALVLMGLLVIQIYRGDRKD